MNSRIALGVTVRVYMYALVSTSSSSLFRPVARCCWRNVVYATDRHDVVYATERNVVYATERNATGCSYYSGDSNFGGFRVPPCGHATEQADQSGRTLVTARSILDRAQKIQIDVKVLYLCSRGVLLASLLLMRSNSKWK